MTDDEAPRKAVGVVVNSAAAVSSRRSLRQLEIADHLWDVVEQASFEMGADPSVLINQALFAWACQHGYLQPGTMPRAAQARPAVRAVNAPAAAPIPVPSAPTAAPPGIKQKTVTAPMPALPRAVAMKSFPKKERAARDTDRQRPPPLPTQRSSPPPPIPPPVAPIAEVTSPMSSGVNTGELDWLPGEAPDLGPDEPPADQTALIDVKKHQTKAEHTVVGRPDRQLFLFVEGLDPVEIAGPTFIIGRDHGCDLPLLSSRISRQHARITRDANGVTIEDLQSSNGTWYNGERITQHGIEHGDEFEIGDFQLRFEYR